MHNHTYCVARRLKGYLGSEAGLVQPGPFRVKRSACDIPAGENMV